MEAAQRDKAPLGPVAVQLRKLRTRAVLILLLMGVASLLGLAIAAAIAWGLLDYLVRLPAWLRGIVLAVGVVGLAVGIRRWAVPALRFRPSLTEIALRLEQSEQGRAAGLSGVLASGLELSDPKPAPATTEWMSAQVVAEAGQRFGRIRPTALINPAGLRRSALVFMVCAAALAGLGALAGHRLMSIGAARILAPWTGAQWPKRTAVADATSVEVHPLNTALPLRAALLSKERGPTRVAARYRILDGSTDGAVRRVLLMDQQRTIAVDSGSATDLAEGELYERLIEPASLVSAAPPDGNPAEIEYWFETEDDRTPPRRIKLVTPPAVVHASAQIVPPEYASIPTTKPLFATGAVDLGAGNDQRAVAGPILTGSRVTLTIQLNKAVPVEDEASGAERRAWLSAMFGNAEIGDTFDAAFHGATWTLTWTAGASLRLPISPTDAYGLKPTDEANFAFDVVPDRPPSATVTEPREDEAVLATAVVSAAGEGRDDVGLSDLKLDAQRSRSAAGSIGAAPEPQGEPAMVASGLGSEITHSTLQASVDLSSFDLKPGDELWLTALAADNYSLAGLRHDPVRSSPRKLRIIKEEELVEQIRAELSAVRKIAMRLDEEQAELRKAVQAGSVTADDRHKQSSLTQRLAQQRQSIQRLQDRAERNRLDDDALSGLLTDVGSLLRGAGEDSDQAASQLDAAAKDQPEQDKTALTPEQAEKAGQAQDSVRDQLGRLAEMLDRGEDSWLVGRNLQRILQQQRDLKARTARAGEKTMGKKAEDLTTQERTDLQQIAEQQQRLADAARQAIEQLDQRSKQMEKVDPAQSQGMKDAAKTGRDQQVPEKMSKAAQATQENQTSTAEEQQQQAMDALEQMVQDMNAAQQNRDQALRRSLADILQSLEKLIATQDAQIVALDAAAESSRFTGLDAPMIELNKNTLDVADKARADRQTARLAELIDKAGANQSKAVGFLRASPVDVEEAGKSERESLRLLKLARAEAKKLHDEAAQRDQDRKRRELRQIYRDRLEAQVALKGDTDPFIGKPVDRRDRMRLRGLGERQDAIRADLEELRKKTQALEDAGVFDLAHTRLNLVGTTAAKRLAGGQADHPVQRAQESAVSILKALVQALDESVKQNDEFRDDPSGGGGNSGSGGGRQQPLIPPLAELRLLRAMQQEAADLTRYVDESKEASAADDLAALGKLQHSLSERADELMKKAQKPPEIPGGKDQP